MTCLPEQKIFGSFVRLNECEDYLTITILDHTHEVDKGYPQPIHDHKQLGQKEIHLYVPKGDESMYEMSLMECKPGIWIYAKYKPEKQNDIRFIEIERIAFCTKNNNQEELNHEL